MAGEPGWLGFAASDWFGEQVRTVRFADQARAIVVAPSPADFDDSRPTLLILYATPNGNTAAQTLGCALGEGRDGHFGIQHVAAQVRRLREVNRRQNLVVACVQPEGSLSWPAWRAARDGGAEPIRAMVDELAAVVPGPVRVVLSGHSGGGSFLFGYLNSVARIPASIGRILFLDANYSWADEDGHGDKVRVWLREDETRRFVLLAYDDREITWQGRKVVGPTGGTYRASHRMLDHLRARDEVAADRLGAFERFSALDGRWLTLVHPNPHNRILHTRLVGEMNGLLYGLTVGTAEAGAWGALGEPRAYEAWVQPAPFE